MFKDKFYKLSWFAMGETVYRMDSQGVQLLGSSEEPMAPHQHPVKLSERSLLVMMEDNGDIHSCEKNYGLKCGEQLYRSNSYH